MSIVLESLPPSIDEDDVRLREPDVWASSPTKHDRRILRALVISGVLAAVWYFSWLFNPVHAGNRYLWGILVGCEVFNLVQACGFWWTVMARKEKKIDLRDPFPVSTEVDVFIPTYNEPVDIVELTVVKSTMIEGANVNVWLLDDGDRPEMAALAERNRIGYIAREDHSGAKAGNINHAMTLTSAPYIVILDCDHVPSEQFLVKTLPDFRDEKVAFVQTPQYYANHRDNPIAAASWAQQSIYYGAICQGKNEHDSVPCGGTNVVFRRSILEEVGGIPTDSITEDYELSIRLHELGYKTTYVPDVLASGLGPEDMASYVSQQHRWARGVLSALPRVIFSKLPFRARMQYLLSSMYWLTGFTVLFYVSLPVLRLVFGVQPLAAVRSDEFLMHFAPFFGLALYTLMRAGQGAFKFSAFAIFSASCWVHMHACWRWIAHRPSKFVVTPKTSNGSWQPRAVLPTLLIVSVLIAASAYGLIKDTSPGTLNNVGFALLHIVVLFGGIWPALVPSFKRNRKEAEAVIERPRLSIVKSADVNV